jgi:predicted alpha/beta superfamily hydrolase
VFGNEEFGDGAGETLRFLQEEVLAHLPGGHEAAGPSEAESAVKRVFSGGYSLAGLFALWAGYQTDRFDGIAAASPSIWFPDFIDYMKNHSIQADAVYLSLGDREERTRNPIMSQVGSAIREAESILAGTETDCVLEWNRGNHFKQPDLRTAKAFAWLMNRK